MGDKLTEIGTKRLEDVTSLDLVWLYSRIDELERQ